MFTLSEMKNHVFQGSILHTIKKFPDESIDCTVTSPPYFGLRNYNSNPVVWWKDDKIVDCDHNWNSYEKKIDVAFCSKCNAWKGELGCEPSPELFVEHLTQIFREIKRITKPSGSLFLNIGDSYFKKDVYDNHPYLKTKDIIGVPWKLAFSLQQDGWYLRNDIIWNKPNVKPESVKDRFTKSHEYIFFMTKNSEYYFNQDAVREPAKNPTVKGRAFDTNSNKTSRSDGNDGTWYNPNPNGRNRRTVWDVNNISSKNKCTQKDENIVSHSAMYPEELIIPCINAGCPDGGIVFDPFMGSGTTAVVALQCNKNYCGTEINPEYIKIQHKKIGEVDIHKYSKENTLQSIIDM